MRLVRLPLPGDGCSHSSITAGLLYPGRGSFFSSAAFGSSLRGVKASTTLRRRRSAPSILGFSLSCLSLFLRFDLGWLVVFSSEEGEALRR
ncbi:hypothetical protein Bca4012_035442 [Brassica carinata]